MKALRFIAALALLLGSSAARADYNFTQGSGTVAFAFTCFSTKVCFSHVAINSAGTEIFTGANPAQVTGANGTFPATQSGTWNIGTLATLTTVTNPVAVTESGNWTVRNVGNAGGIFDFAGQAAATPANAVLVGASFNTTPTTLTNGTSSPLQLDSAGNLLVNIKAGAAAGGTSSSFGAAFPATGTAIGGSDGTNMQAVRIGTYGTTPGAVNALLVNAFMTNANANGRAISSGASPVVPTPATTTLHVISAASTNANFAKASAATLFSCQLANLSTSTIAYVKIYNKASAPTVGTDVPVKTLIVPAPSAGGGGSNVVFGPGGLTLGTGFAYAITAGMPDGDSTAVSASTIALNCDYE